MGMIKWGIPDLTDNKRIGQCLRYSVIYSFDMDLKWKRNRLSNLFLCLQDHRLRSKKLVSKVRIKKFYLLSCRYNPVQKTFPKGMREEWTWKSVLPKVKIRINLLWDRFSNWWCSLVAPLSPHQFENTETSFPSNLTKASIRQVTSNIRQEKTEFQIRYHWESFFYSCDIWL